MNLFSGATARDFHHGLLVERHVEIFQSPFLHVLDPGGLNAIDDQLRVIHRAQKLPQQRVVLPDLLQPVAVLFDSGNARNPNLIVISIEIDR